MEAFPLAWPEGWPRTKTGRRSSRYEVGFTVARDHLLRELRRSGASGVVLSPNIPLRRDGLPYADWREPDDPGIAVYWHDRRNSARVIACDVWRTVRENLRAVGLTLESLRQIERSGASELLERAFSGFARLPETTQARDCWTVLGLPPGTSREQVTARYRELAGTLHPDRGGTHAAMIELNQAYDQARAQ